MEGLAARNSALEQGRIARRQITVVARARSTISLDASRARTGNTLCGLCQTLLYTRELKRSYRFEVQVDVHISMLVPEQQRVIRHRQQHHSPDGMRW